jgi:hypothetical protein
MSTTALDPEDKQKRIDRINDSKRERLLTSFLIVSSDGIFDNIKNAILILQIQKHYQASC